MESIDVNFKRKVLDEIRNVLSGNNTNLEFNNKVSDTNYYYENDCVSLSDIKNILIVKKKEFDKLTKDFELELELKLDKKYNRTTTECDVDEFDYEKQELKITFSPGGYSLDTSCVFCKIDNDLYIKSYESGSFKSIDILVLLGKDILSFFEQKNAYHEYLCDCEFCKSSVNSLFCFDVSSDEISIYCEEDSENIFDKKFELKYDINLEEYEMNVNSYKIIELMYYTQDKIFENIFVKVEDCPKWMHEDLNKVREEKLKPKKEIFSKNSSNRIKQLFKRKKIRR